MIILKNILADLVEKKLWLPAAFLVAALVAVPMTLARPGEPTATVIPAPPAVEEDEGPSLSLTRTATTGFGKAPRVNDKRLDPFGARYPKSLEKALQAYLRGTDDVINGCNCDSGDTSFGDGGGTTIGGSDGGVTPVPPDDTDPGTGGDKPPKTSPIETERDDLLTVLITSGSADPVELTDIRTLSPLPNTENPFLVYVGKADSDKVSFLVSADVTVSGDGVCAPSPTDCRTLTMGIGDTADFVLLNEANAKVSVTVTDLETKDVPVSGDVATQQAAQLEAETRAVGARALKAVLRDDVILESLIENGVKIRS